MTAALQAHRLQNPTQHFGVYWGLKMYVVLEFYRAKACDQFPEGKMLPWPLTSPSKKKFAGLAEAKRFADERIGSSIPGVVIEVRETAQGKKVKYRIERDASGEIQKSAMV